MAASALSTRFAVDHTVRQDRNYSPITRSPPCRRQHVDALDPAGNIAQAQHQRPVTLPEPRRTTAGHADRGPRTLRDTFSSSAQTSRPRSIAIHEVGLRWQDLVSLHQRGCVVGWARISRSGVRTTRPSRCAVAKMMWPRVPPARAIRHPFASHKSVQVSSTASRLSARYQASPPGGAALPDLPGRRSG